MTIKTTNGLRSRSGLCAECRQACASRNEIKGEGGSDILLNARGNYFFKVEKTRFGLIRSNFPLEFAET